MKIRRKLVKTLKCNLFLQRRLRKKKRKFNVFTENKINERFLVNKFLIVF